MYGSDAYYAENPHTYHQCTCLNREPHCWYCGESPSAPIHVMTVEVEPEGVAL